MEDIFLLLLNFGSAFCSEEVFGDLFIAVAAYFFIAFLLILAIFLWCKIANTDVESLLECLAKAFKGGK